MFNVYRIGFMPRPKVKVATVESFAAFESQFGPFVVCEEDSDHPNHFDALGTDFEQYALEPVSEK